MMISSDYRKLSEDGAERKIQGEISGNFINFTNNGSAHRYSIDTNTASILHARANSVTPWGSVLELFSVGFVIGWICFTLFCFLLKHPPVNPMQMSAVLCWAIMITFIVDIIFQFMISWHNDAVCHGRFVINCFLHHTVSISFLVTPLVYDERKYYIIMLLFLSVEVNTLFLKIRRVVKKFTWRYQIIHFLFLFSWFLQRAVMFPALTIYLWYIWYVERGHKLELFLNACIMAVFLNCLYILWTINLLGKQKNPILVEATIAHIHEKPGMVVPGNNSMNSMREPLTPSNTSAETGNEILI